MRSRMVCRSRLPGRVRPETDNVRRVLRPGGPAVLDHTGPPVPVLLAPAPRGVRAHAVRHPAAQGVHPDHRRGRRGQEHAVPRRPRGARPLRHRADPQPGDEPDPAPALDPARARPLRPRQRPGPPDAAPQRVPARPPPGWPGRRAAHRRGAGPHRRLLEEVRLLSNLETDDRKLLQIVLLGQPELRDSLDRPELRQLRQRITVRYHLGPIDPRRPRRTSSTASRSPAPTAAPPSRRRRSARSTAARAACRA